MDDAMAVVAGTMVAMAMAVVMATTQEAAMDPAMGKPHQPATKAARDFP